jgi:hypothetical protein
MSTTASAKRRSFEKFWEKEPDAWNTSIAVRPDEAETRLENKPSKARRAWSALHNNIGLVPLAAPLLAAGYYQADLAAATFGWAFPWYLLFPLSIEAGAAWAAGNYYRRLLSGHSTISARLGMLTYAAASGLLLYWHARNTGRPTAAAYAVAGLTFAGVWIWTQKAKHDNRTRLEEMGLVDKQVPRFSFARWVLCPLETPSAFRWAVKYSYSDPSEALTDYRTRNETGQTENRAQIARGDLVKALGGLDRLAAEADAVKPFKEPKTRTRGPSSGGKRGGNDEALVRKLKEKYPDWQTRTLDPSEIRRVIGGGQSRAYRFQTLLKEQMQ